MINDNETHTNTHTNTRTHNMTHPGLFESSFKLPAFFSFRQRLHSMHIRKIAYFSLPGPEPWRLKRILNRRGLAVLIADSIFPPRAPAMLLSLGPKLTVTLHNALRAQLTKLIELRVLGRRGARAICHGFLRQCVLLLCCLLFRCLGALAVVALFNAIEIGADFSLRACERDVGVGVGVDERENVHVDVHHSAYRCACACGYRIWVCVSVGVYVK
jgi:hypothetical protein